MSLREHVFDLQAGVVIPLRHPRLLHRLLHLRLQSLPLTHGFHCLEGHRRILALADEVNHNIIAAADAACQRADALCNQIRSVAKPHVRSVGKARNLDQLRQRCRFGILQHSHDKLRSEFRNTERADLDAAVLLRRNSEGFQTNEQLHDALIVQRKLNRIHARDVLQHSDHRRIIVSQNVELQQVVVNGMIVKMRCDNRRCHIVGRVLHRRKRIDLLSERKNHDAAGVLTGRSPHTDAPSGKPLDFTLSLADASVLTVAKRIAVGCLVGDRRNGARLEGLLMAENNLRIGMRLGLVLSREVQVDIRLLVSLEAKEGLKRNVKAGTGQRLPAVRAVLLRHIHAAFPRIGFYLLGIKIRIMARLTVVMRRQRIDLCNSGHCRNKGGADRSPGSDQISVLVRLPHELLRNDVHNGISVLDDGRQLPLQPVLHHLRQRISVHLVGLPVTDLTQLSVRVLDDRRAFVGADRRNHIDPGRDPVRIGDDNLLALRISQIGKFLHHLIRRLQIQRCRLLLLIHAHAVLNDGAVDLVLRIQKMHISGSDNGLSVLLSEADNLPVDVQNVLLAPNALIAVRLDEEFVVSSWLDFQIVVEIHNSRKRLLALLIEKRLIQLTHHAGRADNKALPVFHQKRFRNLRLLIEVR